MFHRIYASILISNFFFLIAQVFGSAFVRLNQQIILLSILVLLFLWINQISSFREVLKFFECKSQRRTHCMFIEWQTNTSQFMHLGCALKLEKENLEQVLLTYCLLMLPLLIECSQREIKTFPNFHPNHLKDSLVYDLKTRDIAPTIKKNCTYRYA